MLLGWSCLTSARNGQASSTAAGPRQCVVGGSGYSRAKHDPDDTRRKSRLEPRKSWPWIGRNTQVSEEEAALHILSHGKTSVSQRRVKQLREARHRQGQNLPCAEVVHFTPQGV